MEEEINTKVNGKKKPVSKLEGLENDVDRVIRRARYTKKTIRDFADSLSSDLENYLKDLDNNSEQILNAEEGLSKLVNNIIVLFSF